MAPGRGVLKQIQRVELSACATAASFLQSDFWGAFKARFGWEALAFDVQWDWEGSSHEGSSGGQAGGCLLALRRSLAAGFSLAYIPLGPELPEGFPAGLREAALTELALALKALFPPDTAFIRFDPPWHTEGPSAPPPRIPPPFVRAPADIQAPDTVLVDLARPVESVLAEMKPKWRYNARLALKRGVTARRAGAEEVGVFYGLLKETARRDGIAIHGQEYYAALLDNGWYNGAPPDIRLYLAEHEGDVLAGIVTLFRGPQAVYLYGASSGKKRNLMAPYALQVKAMEDASAAGCRQYDLFGIPPSGDPSHPMAGLYLFKTGFGGRIIHRPGSWDFPCRPLLYRLFRGAEALRKRLRTLRKKRA
ncbi:MAG: peptidoglycan bridge formation glycyltransferase FemA/FemB family protein [Treponema sp.]|nr:peptidoglycan bridge formation glycyltransferase FemA/FemB family protein [Treponema sp.]